MHDPETEPEEKHRIDFEDDNDNKFRFGDIDWPDEVVSLTLMRSLRAWKIALMIFLFLLNSIYKSSSLLTNMAIPHLLKNHQRFGWQNSTWVFWTSRCWVGGFYSSWQWRAATPSGQFKSAPRMSALEVRTRSESHPTSARETTPPKTTRMNHSL